MARVSKAPDVRRDELLDIALRLCAEVGYDAMSIDQVTRTASVAKGTFYYHFPTKQHMLIALVERFAEELFADLDATAARLTGSAIDQFRALMIEATAWKTARLDDSLAFVPLLYKPENLELRHRLFDTWGQRTGRLFAPIVALGAADGSFGVQDADATTQLVLTLWVDGSTRMYDRALAAPDEDTFVDILQRGVAALMTAVERILGANPGSFTLDVDPAVLRAMRAPFLAALNPSERN